MRDKLIAGMVANGYEPEFAQAIFKPLDLGHRVFEPTLSNRLQQECEERQKAEQEAGN